MHYNSILFTQYACMLTNEYEMSRVINVNYILYAIQIFSNPLILSTEVVSAWIPDKQSSIKIDDKKL